MASSPTKTDSFHSCSENMDDDEQNTSNDMTEDMGDVVDDGAVSQLESEAKEEDEPDGVNAAIPSNQDYSEQPAQSESKPNDDTNTNDVPIAESTNVEQDDGQNQEDPPGDKNELTPENPKIVKRSRSIDDEEADEDKSQKDTIDNNETGEANEEPYAEDEVPATQTAPVAEEGEEGPAENQFDTQASSESDLPSQNNTEKPPTETEEKDQTQQNTIDQESETKESPNSSEIQQPEKEAVVTAESTEIETEKESKVSPNSPATAESPGIVTEKEKKETSETLEEGRKAFETSSDESSSDDESSDNESSDDDSADDESSDDETSDDESTGLNTSQSEPASPTRITDSHHTDINSMSEASNTLADLKHLASRAHELVAEKPTDGDRGKETPNIDNRKGKSGSELPTDGKNLFKNEQVKFSKPVNSENDDQSDSENSKHSDVNDSISKGIVNEASKTPPRDNVPSSKPDKPVASSNNSQLKDLEDLLQFTPSSAKHSVASSTAKQSAVSSVNDEKSQGLKRLEDVLGSTPSNIQSNEIYDDKTPTEIDDDIEESGRNPNLKHLEDLMHSSTPYKNRSNSTLNDSVLNEMHETISTLPEPTDLMELVHASVASVTPSATKDKDASSVTKDKVTPTKDSTNDQSAPIQDSALALPNTNRSPKIIEGPYPIPHQDQDVHSVFSDAAASAQGLSVFSDATSGQDFLRYVSDAKKKLQEIDDEMSELKGVTEPHERTIADAINSSHAENKNEIPPVETRPNNESVEPQVPKERKPVKEKERRVEPPTRSKQDVSKKSSSSDEKKKKERRKTSKKKQVRPNKETSSKDAMDPDGKVMPRTHYSKSRGERNKDASQKGAKQRNRDASEKIAGKIDEDLVRKNDPPMVIGGHLEAEEAPIEKKKRKKKKNKKKVNREYEEPPPIEEPPFEEEEDVGMMNTGSVVSSRRMDRGDDDDDDNDDWSVPVNEVNIDYDEEGDAAKSKNTQDPYDPWAEVPCSWCCRYLPHTLVVATTQAYRLDKADEKESGRLSDRL